MKSYDSKPTFSIIMPVKNSELTLLESINSVLTQEISSTLELIVVISGSSDRSDAILRGISDKRLRIIRGEEINAFEAMNRGVLESGGEYIVFLNSDDVFFCCNTLRTYERHIEMYCPDIVYGDVLIGSFSTDGFSTRRYWRSPVRFEKSQPWRGYYPAHPGLAVRRDFALSVGPIPAAHQVVGDLFYIEKILRAKPSNAFSLGLPTVKMRLGGLSTRSLTSILRHNLAICSILKGNGQYFAIIELMFLKPWNKFYQFWSAYVYRKRQSDSIME